MHFNFITAGNDSDLNLFCGKCSTSHISGDHGSVLNVTCRDESSCIYSTIDGRDAASLSLNGCSNHNCYHISIWCPKQRDGKKYCFVEGDDDGLRKVNIYAVNSWHDIQITIPDDDADVYDDGDMFCTANYDESCSINKWQCANPSNVCQMTVVTSFPTLSSNESFRFFRYTDNCFSKFKRTDKCIHAKFHCRSNQRSDDETDLPYLSLVSKFQRKFSE